MELQPTRNGNSLFFLSLLGLEEGSGDDESIRRQGPCDEMRESLCDGACECEVYPDAKFGSFSHPCFPNNARGHSFFLLFIEFGFFFLVPEVYACMYKSCS